MSSKWLSSAVLVLAALGLSSCSGLNDHTHPCTDCNTNTATVTLTLFDTPPTGVTFLNFNLPITAVTLTPSSGASVSLYAPSSPVVFEATNLQGTSDFVSSSATVPTGTYTAMNILLGTGGTSVIINGSSVAVGSCGAYAVCGLAAAAPGQVTVQFSPALTLTSNQKVGVGLNFNLNNAVTTQNGITVDFQQPNVFTLTALPRLNQASNTFDTIQNFTGTVTAISNSSITVNSGTRGSLTAAINSTSTTLVDPQNKCTVSVATCFTTGATVGLDAQVNEDGTLTATVIDMLDTASVDEIEGIVYPTSQPGVYGLVMFDKTVVSSNSILAAATPGTVFAVSAVSGGATYGIDYKNLTPTSQNGFTGSGDIYPGQMLRVHVVTAVAGSGAVTSPVVTTDRVVLRFAPFTGTISSVNGSSNFAIADLPSYMGNFAFPPQVQTFSGSTVFDGVTGVTGANFAVGDTVSMNALYLNPTTANPPFLASTVRVK